MKQFSISKQRGLTLIEASVSAAVVGIALLGILRLQMQLTKDNADSPVRTAALNAAQQKMEQLRFLAAAEGGYDELINGSDSPLSASELLNATLARSWTVATPSASNLNYKLVTVTVSWESASSHKQEMVVLSSYIAKTDPTQAGAFLKGLSSSNP
jgi:type II secretory pathway pseudopilin PulG